MIRKALGIAICVVGMLGWATQANEKPFDPDWKVPEKAAQQKNPLAGKSELAAGGSKLFARMCATCHGDQSHSQTKGAPDLRNELIQQESDGSLFWRISNGNSRKGMPSFSSLPEAQRWQLVMYIRTLGTETPTKK